jgi:hypothetical protein
MPVAFTMSVWLADAFLLRDHRQHCILARSDVAVPNAKAEHLISPLAATMQQVQQRRYVFALVAHRQALWFRQTAQQLKACRRTKDYDFRTGLWIVAARGV